MVSSTSVPPATSSSIATHSSLRLRGSSPVVGSSRSKQTRRADEAGAEVEAALHAAGVGADQPVAGVGEAHLLEHRVGGLRALVAVVTEQPRHHAEVLTAGQRGLDRGVLAGEADAAAHLLRVLGHVDAGDLQRARGRSGERGDGADQRGLARTVGAEHREHLARGDRQIQAGQRLDVAEVLLETFGLDHHVHHATLRDDPRRTDEFRNPLRSEP